MEEANKRTDALLQEKDKAAVAVDEARQLALAETAKLAAELQAAKEAAAQALIEKEQSDQQLLGKWWWAL